MHGYRIAGTLGRGGLGTTFSAVRESTGESVALKRLALRDTTEWKRVELFEREARVLEALNHPSIPRYVEHFSVDGADGAVFYIAQELVPGQSLAELHRSGRVPMAEAEVLRIALELLGILDHLGRLAPPVVHRDIKPDNVIVRPDGSVALVDFGAVAGGMNGAGGGSTTVGTYGYMASEQLHGAASPATDIYGLACTVLFLLSGVSPAELPRKKLVTDFRSDPRVRVSAPFALWLDRALEPAPEDRFPSAFAARAALRGPRGTPEMQSASAFPRRVTTWTAVVATCAMLGSIALMNVWLIRSSGRHSAQSSSGAGGALPPRWKTNAATSPLTFVRWIPAHMSAIFSVAVSASGDKLASGCNDGTVKLWDVKTGEALRSYPGHTSRVGGVAFTPDGSELVSAGDHVVLVQSASAGATRLSLDADKGAMTSVDVSPDGRLVAGGTMSGTVSVWSLETGKLLHTLAHGAHVISVGFSPDGRLLATSGDGPVKIWSADTGILQQALAGHAGIVGHVAWAPDGRNLATCGDDHTTRFWGIQQTKELTRKTESTDEVWAVAYEPHGKYLGAVGKDGIVRIYDAVTTDLLAWHEIDKKGVLSIAWTPSGETFFAGVGDGRIAQFTMAKASKADTIPQLPPNTVDIPSSATDALSIYRRAMLLVSGARENRARFDDAEKLLRDGMVADPKNGLYAAGLARVVISRGLGRPDEFPPGTLEKADELTSHALALSSDVAEIHVIRGWVLTYKHELLLAKDEAISADRLGSSARSEDLLAELAYRAKDFDGAEAHALKAIKQSTRDEAGRPFDHLRAVYQKEGDYTAVERAYDRLLELEPGNAWTRGNYAEFLVWRGSYDRAIALAHEAIAMADYPAAHHTLSGAYCEKGAQALWGSGKDEVAKAAFDDAVLADPTSWHAHYGLGAYFRKLATSKKDKSLLVRSNDELRKAANLEKDTTLAKTAIEENERLSKTL